MAIVGRCLSWLGFLYASLLTASALYLLLQLNLTALQTLIFLLALSLLAGLPYLLLALLNKFVSGSFGWLPWRLS